MIYNLINYSLEQKLYDYSLKQIEDNLLEIIFNKNKFLVYHSNIQGPVNKRPTSERRIQLNPKLKETLHSYMGEDYKIVLLGFDKTTNTFSFWNYGYNINMRSQQSLPTRIQTLNKAKAVGFDFHYYKNRNLADRPTTEHSFAINAFLFPLILENYYTIFNRDFSEIFRKKIQSWNKPYTKDDHILCLDLYWKKYPINRNSIEVSEISELCNRRSDLLNFIPKSLFYHKDIAKDFRNNNGISSKLENIDSGCRKDPLLKNLVFNKDSKKKGRISDAYAVKILLEEFLTKSNTIDKEKLSKRAGVIKNKILSKSIEVLIGERKIENFENGKIERYTYDESHPNLLLDFDFNRSQKESDFNESEYADPVESIIARLEASKEHYSVVKKLALICHKKRLIKKYSLNIDFYTEYKNRGKLFEIKTFNESNFKSQLRHAIVQLKEYYFKHAIYLRNIPNRSNLLILNDTDLFILLNKSPESLIKKEQIEFLKNQNIVLCWFQNDQVTTFVENRPTIKWLL
jgi:hypothetical protein